MDRSKINLMFTGYSTFQRIKVLSKDARSGYYLFSLQLGSGSLQLRAFEGKVAYEEFFNNRAPSWWGFTRNVVQGF